MESLDQLVFGGADQDGARTISRGNDDSFAHKAGRQGKYTETDQHRPPAISMEAHARPTNAHLANCRGGGCFERPETIPPRDAVESPVVSPEGSA